MKSLLIYLGVKSKYYGIYEDDSLFEARIAYNFNELVTWINGEKSLITVQEYHSSLQFALDRAKSTGIDLADIVTVGIRVSLPGDFFTTTRVIDGEYIKNIRDLKDLIPDQNTVEILHEIAAINRILPEAHIFGISDTEFYKDMPAIARDYAVYKKDKKFGSHGIIVESAIEEVINKGFKFEKVIVCNLDDTCSVTAVKDGKSIDTSTGFTEFDGLVGEINSGNVDASYLSYLAQSQNLGWKQLNYYLTQASGLYALSNNAGDLQVLEYLYRENNLLAKQVLEYLAYNIKKYVGSYVAILDGIDALVFTGNSGANQSLLREIICKNLDIFGIHLDKEYNNSPEDFDGIINNGSKIKILTVGDNRLSHMFEIINKSLH